MAAKADVELKDFSNIFSLDGKVALVTGGSRGLGLHAASGLLRAECSKVYITSRKAKACEEACAALNAIPSKRPGATAISVPADLSKMSEIERLVDEVRKTTEHLDILFANAGATWGSSFEDHPPSAFDKVMTLNVKSVFYTVQKFEPLLRKRATTSDPSHVVVTASVAAMEVGPTGAVGVYSYAASKAAVTHLAKYLALELGPRGIVTNVVAPGFYPTKMAGDWMEAQGGVQSVIDTTPNRRVGRPEDIAALVVFLSGRGANHLNGAVITTDGGAVLANHKL